MDKALLARLLARFSRLHGAPIDVRRRAILQATVLLATSGLATVRSAFAQTRPRFVADPFALGVASGYPRSDGVTLWTRLAPAPLAEDAGMQPETVEVRWQVAHDAQFARIEREGKANAYPETAHALHVDVDGLEPGRWYHYRFMAGDATSDVGRTRTAPVDAKSMRFAIGSCQHYEHGFFASQRHLAGENLDLMLFLGDYIYESSWGEDFVRRHLGVEANTLSDYRRWYGQYKSDADLRALHAAVPFAFCWDDHEVDNDYANDRSEHLDPDFLTRRAAAYRAYFENQPLPARMLSANGAMRMFDRLDYGSLASFHLVDNRQYRSHQSCVDPAKGGGGSNYLAGCDTMKDESRTMLGDAQERWFADSMRTSKAHWNFVAQQTLIAPMDFDPAPAEKLWTDGWDGYPAARRRMLDAIAASKATNPVALGGDIHATCIADIKRDPLDPKSAKFMPEFVSTSLAAQGWPADVFNAHGAYNEHMHLLDATNRGYLTFQLTRDRLEASVRVIDSEKRRDAKVSTQATFEVASGSPTIART